ncbi:MAG: GTP 3',8-cyclase MoaA [Candidatus Brockarchaeota archaeon]|nr:GTP 3',8-cyclase MoaA [Candidatus Brockarchaeota archaeon]MBO3808402.1 GTP 3',8-cyclase MoaA [Candidatus Brockarchaeota archaeon]
MFQQAGRPLKNLRISVTDNCNLNCFFCHREWNPPPRGSMTLNEVRKIVEVASSIGVETVKITGGEPLVREDVVDIVKAISPLVREVSLVTNGVLLEEYAGDLKDAGLARVNVNLPSLDSSKYSRITGGGDVLRVFKGINAALETGLNPVRINMVVLKRVNEEDVEEMLDYAGSIGAVLQLIELQPIPGGEKVFQEFHASLKDVEKTISSKSAGKTVNYTGQRPIYMLPRNGRTVLVEIVSPTGNLDFCSHCSKLRVTCDGRLKPCLLRNDNLVDIVGLMRSGGGDDDLKRSFMEAIMLKKPYWDNRVS